MNRNFLKTVVALAVMVVAGSLSSAFAASYTFNFNSVTSGAANSAIQSYMQGIVGGAATVSLSGAKEAAGYNGDGHVVNNATLGNDDAGTDRFIITLQDGLTDTIKMQFTGLNIYSVTFDYEIFPDAGCPSSSNCPNLPDFTLLAGNNGSTSTIFHDYGVFPSGQPSPMMPGGETAAQKIVHQALYSPGTSFNTIWFQDWPATIGIDNITINTTKPPVPEPASLLLMGSGVLAIIRRKAARKN